MRTKKAEGGAMQLKPIDIRHATVTIKGTGDLVLNKMNARNTRTLMDKQNNRPADKRPANPWEDICTAVRWSKSYKELGIDDTYEQCDESTYHKLCEEAKPCITSFGLKQSFKQAVVRNEIDTYSTKFDNAVNIVADKGLVPVTISEAWIDERLMSPQKGAPVLVRLNHFSGWSASFDITYTSSVYSLEQIVDIIRLAGFGLGIGSGRTSGYGRYEVVSVVEEKRAA